MGLRKSECFDWEVVRKGRSVDTRVPRAYPLRVPPVQRRSARAPQKQQPELRLVASLSCIVQLLLEPRLRGRGG